MYITVMLEWFVSSSDTEKALTHGELLEEEPVETMPEKVPNCCIDWSCKVCDKDFQDSTAIACDCCLEWFHLICVGLRNAPKQKEWFCRFCFGKDVL